MEKVCFLFGHNTAPESLLSTLESAIEICCTELGVRQFVVGQHGDFDRLAMRALRAVKQRHDDVELSLLLHYHPAEHHIELPKDFDGSIYPEGMEAVPRRAAIVVGNRCMVRNADFLICYVRHPGNSKDLMEYAQKQGKVVINIAKQQNGMFT